MCKLDVKSNLHNPTQIFSNFSEKSFCKLKECNLFERRELAKIIETCKEEYEAECTKKVWNSRKRKMVTKTPKEGFISKAVRKHFVDMKSRSCSDPDFLRAIWFARRCYNSYKTYGDEGEPSELKKRKRNEGSGRKTLAPEFRDET